MKKKITSMLIAAAMLVTMMPFISYAEGDENLGGETAGGSTNQPFWTDDNDVSEGSYVNRGNGFPLIRNNSTDKSLTVIFEICPSEQVCKSTKETDHQQCQKATFTVEAEEGLTDNALSAEGKTPYEFLSGSVYKAGKIIDNSTDDPAALTYRFFDPATTMTDAQKNELEKAEKKIKQKLDKINGYEDFVKIADPDKLDFTIFEDESGKVKWTRADALETIFGCDALAARRGVDRSLNINNGQSSYFLEVSYYKDRKFQEPVEISEMQPDTEYYGKVSYIGEYTFSDGMTVASTVALDNRPIVVEYTIADIDPNSPEVKQIKENAKIEAQHRIPYEDLGWISVLNFVGYNPKLPPVQNSDTILQTFAPELYQKLKGNTDLTLKLAFGGAGDAASFSSSTEAAVYYYIGDVFCATGTSCSINMTDILYVPQGSTDRAASAEDRIKTYMGKKKYDVTVSALDSQALLELAKKEFSYEDWSQYDDVKAAYLTQNGIALYADKSETSKEQFRGVLGFDASEDVLASLEKEKSLDYFKPNAWEDEQENVQAYKAYKLTLKGHEYLYVIGTKNQSELKSPLAHWKDEKCGIMTNGENGQVVADAYTEVDPVESNKLSEIKNQVNGADVQAFDITALSNFSETKITDLNGGTMEVMIPLDKSEAPGAKAFYYDDNGNVQYLDTTIKEVDGVTYACFDTTHFSTYGIASAKSAAGGNGGQNPAKDPVGATGKTDASKGAAAADAAKTGDDFPIGLCAVLLLLALGGSIAAIAVRRKQI